MKSIAKILLLAIIALLSLTLFGCTNVFEPQYRAINSLFMVTINGVNQQDTVDFEISLSYRIVIKLFGDVEVDDDTYKDIQIEYNEENAVVTSVSNSSRSKELSYYIYLYDLGRDDKLKITYQGKTVEVDYNVIDYDFEYHGYTAPTAISDLDKYPEFKEMLLSMKYHEFKAPYIGLDYYSYNEYRNEGSWYYNLKYKNDTDYLKYLTDSVYYPSSFDLVEQNPVAHREVYMKFQGREKVQNGADRSVMDYFSVSYSVIDPGCTNPEYPLLSMSFSARSKEGYMYAYLGEYPNRESILLEKYLDRFFQYQMGEVTIYILATKNNGALAYFIHGDYFYELHSNYERIITE
jgi:hypothetical protein